MVIVTLVSGRLIPAGTGFKGSKKHAMIEEMEAEFRAQEAAVSIDSTVKET